MKNATNPCFILHFIVALYMYEAKNSRIITDEIFETVLTETETVFPIGLVGNSSLFFRFSIGEVKV